jgi:hypothetical protein
MTLDSLKAELKGLVPKGPVKTFNRLNEVIRKDASIFSDFILLQARFNGLTEQIMQGTVTDDFGRRELNKINQSVLYFIDRLENEDIIPSLLKKETISMEEELGNLSQQEKAELLKNASLITEKVGRLRDALALETDPIRQLKYEKDIEAAEKQLADIKKKL